MAHESTGTKPLVLPTLIFGPVEVRRLQREMEALSEYMVQAAIRAPGKQAPLPRTSRLLEALAENNKLNLLQHNDRKTLTTFLDEVGQKAPVIHISFAADPSAAFTGKVVSWLRSNIHQYALVQLGLQPSIAAGCIVRTRNKSFDFSLRNHFLRNSDFLIRAIEGKTS